MTPEQSHSSAASFRLILGSESIVVDVVVIVGGTQATQRCRDGKLWWGWWGNEEGCADVVGWVGGLMLRLRIRSQIVQACAWYVILAYITYGVLSVVYIRILCAKRLHARKHYDEDYATSGCGGRCCWWPDVMTRRQQHAMVCAPMPRCRDAANAATAATTTAARPLTPTPTPICEKGMG